MTVIHSWASLIFNVISRIQFKCSWPNLKIKMLKHRLVQCRDLDYFVNVCLLICFWPCGFISPIYITTIALHCNDLRHHVCIGSPYNWNSSFTCMMLYFRGSWRLRKKLISTCNNSFFPWMWVYLLILFFMSCLINYSTFAVCNILFFFFSWHHKRMQEYNVSLNYLMSPVGS